MRRAFLRITVIGWLLMLLAAAPAVGSDERPDPVTSFETVDLQNGIVAFISPEARAQLVSGNSVAIIGQDAVLVVDSGQFPTLTRRMIAEIRKRTDKPVRYLVNTHWHNDHLIGNSVYREEYPGIAIISTPATKANGDQYDPQFLQMEKDAMPGMSAKIKKMLETGKRPNGKEIDQQARENYQALLVDVEEFAPIVQEMHYAGPNVTFTEEMDIDLGKRTVRVMFLGKGNTAGDAVVYVPDAKVLATGDLVVMPIPFATASYVEDWIHTLDKLQTFEITAMIPGHGPVQRDFAYTKTVEDTLKSLFSQVRDAVAQGKTLEETEAAVNLEREKAAATAGSPIRGNNWDTYFQRPGIASAYKQLKGIPTDENPFATGK